jgi:SAM-dependent methyltransferase
MPPRAPIAWEAVGDPSRGIGWESLSATANFGAATEPRSVNRIFDDSEQSEVVWQPDVYHEAKRLAGFIDCERVIDIGCGNGCKLGASFDASEVELVAVDFKLSLAAARENVAAATFIECDLGAWHATAELVARLQSSQPTIIIFADVIEHLPDPLPILNAIRNLLAMNPCNRLVISTPDSQRLESDPRGLPRNEAHVREWSLDGIRNLLASSGFAVTCLGHTRSNQHDEVKRTSILLAAFDRDVFGDRLSQLGIPEWAHTRHLLVTTEYSGVGIVGGIGTYVALQHARDERRSLVVYCRTGSDAPALKPGVIDVVGLLTPDEVDRLPIEDRVLAAVSRLLFLLPDVETVEFQEYRGIGMRICQAKLAGLLPGKCKTIVHCHGNTHYLENAMQSWTTLRDQFLPVREKISIELADIVVFPSLFLRQFYERMGIKCIGTVGVQPPAHSLQPTASARPATIDTIVFLGKRTRMKGFDLFVEAFTPEFTAALSLRGIRNVVVIAPATPRWDGSRVELPKAFPLVEHSDFGHQQVVEYVLAHAGRALFVEPYRADNFPLAVRDVVMNGGDLVAARAGGIPEIFQTAEFWSDCLFDLSRQDLQRCILDMLDRTPEQRQQIRESLVSAHDEAAGRFGGYRQWTTSRRLANKTPSATIMVPFFNTDLSYIEDVFFGINHQTESPAEVIIVDDGSEPDSSEGLRRLAQERLTVPFRIIRHPSNRGLPAARNTALAACSTEILINNDSDDVPLSNFVRNITRAFARNPEFSLAVPYQQYFDDGSWFQTAFAQRATVYRPVGDGLIACLKENRLAHANVGVRVEVARRVGGWDESSRAKFEDWAFYLKLIARGERILVLPSIDTLYRVRRNSMLRTYSDWEGFSRLSITPDGLPRFEAIELQRHLRTSIPMEGLHVRVAVSLAESLAGHLRGNRIARSVWRRLEPFRRG